MPREGFMPKSAWSALLVCGILLVVLGIPLLIAIQAWVRDRWRWKDRKKPELKEERPGCDKEIGFLAV
jgi:hypothetical protein